MPSQTNPATPSHAAPFTRRRRLWWLAGFAVALIGLNLAFSFHNVWPTPWIRLSHELSVEIAVLILLVGLYAGWRGTLSARWRAVLTGLLFIMVLGRYAEVVAPALFGRPINLYWDLQHTPQVVQMVAAVAPTWQILGAALGLTAVIGGLVAGLWWAIGMISRTLAVPAVRRPAMLAAVAIVAVYTAGMASREIGTERWFAIPVSVTYAKQAEFLVDIAVARPADAEFAEPPLTRSDLQRLQGGDAYILFLESYGAITLDHPEISALLAPSLATLTTTAVDGGWHVASALVAAPTYGGASWLSHASFLAGVEIARHHDYQLLLTSRRETLVGRFRAAGYHTVALMPGLKQRWPEGQYYDFDRMVGADDLAYPGPDFGWWAIPDQYSLDWLHRSDPEAGRQHPRLVFFPSITSHMPFSPQPPYVPDWTELVTAYRAATPTDESGSWTDLTAAYGRAIAYDLDVVAGFLRNWAADDAFVLVIGDHQPPAAVGGPDLPWQVPTHVFSRNPALIARFEAAGFVPGIRPPKSELGGMVVLNRIVLQVLDSGSALPDATAMSGSG